MTSSTTQAPKMTARQEMEEMVVKNCPLPPLLPAIDSEGFPVWMTKQGKDDWKAKAISRRRRLLRNELFVFVFCIILSISKVGH
jgi:hypothetical protein